MKVFGIVLLLLGLLALGGGLVGAAVSQIIPNEECALADQYKADSDRLSREADAARGTSNESKLRTEALDKMESARIWAKGCSDRRTLTTMAMIGGFVVATGGFVLALVGLLVFRRGKRAVA